MDAAGREMQVRTFVEEVWNGKNYAAVADLYAETYVNPFGTGPAARAEPIRRYRQTFPDLHFDIEELIVAGDTVVLRAAFRGTDTGGYAGRAATRRAVNAWVVTIMHFDGDRVIGEWIVADNLGLFIQLGVVDNPMARLAAKSPRQIRYPAVQVTSLACITRRSARATLVE